MVEVLLCGLVVGSGHFDCTQASDSFAAHVCDKFVS